LRRQRVVWGSGPYTSDRDIGAPTRHVCAIGHAGGEVTMSRLGRLERYTGSQASGVDPSDWQSCGSALSSTATEVAT